MGLMAAIRRALGGTGISVPQNVTAIQKSGSLPSPSDDADRERRAPRRSKRKRR